MKLMSIFFAAALSLTFLAQTAGPVSYQCDPLGVDRECGKYGP